jgi:hypothetical protein
MINALCGTSTFQNKAHRADLILNVCTTSTSIRGEIQHKVTGKDHACMHRSSVQSQDRSAVREEDENQTSYSSSRYAHSRYKSTTPIHYTFKNAFDDGTDQARIYSVLIPPVKPACTAALLPIIALVVPPFCFIMRFLLFGRLAWWLTLMIALLVPVLIVRMLMLLRMTSLLRIVTIVPLLLDESSRWGMLLLLQWWWISTILNWWRWWQIGWWWWRQS